MSSPDVIMSEDRRRPGNRWKGVYITGGVAAVSVALAGIGDIAIGFALGGDLSKLPGTAIDRFVEFLRTPWLGLYHLDLLNATTTLILAATFLALYAAHRRVERGPATLAMVIEIIGTAVFIANNAALPMLALSAKYAVAPTEAQRMLLAAAGESLLARGEHGTPGVFPGFLMLSIAGIIMSSVILRGRVFNRATGWTGLLSNSLLLAYVILVTFVPGMKALAMLMAAPGGLLAVAWLVLVAVGLFRLSRCSDS